jgi:hypothetical protein
MRNTSELPAFTPAGGANLLLHIADLSGGHYVQQPEPTPWLGKALVAFFLGAALTGALMVWQ